MNNPWIRYFDRTYQQIREQILVNLANRVPEMSDRTDNNLFVRLLSIWAGIAEMLGYYIDNAARESFAVKARKFSSMVALAEQFDVRVRSHKAATTEVTFTLAATVGDTVVFPAGSSVFTADGVEFITMQAGEIPGGQLSVTVPVRQATAFTGQVLGISNGTARQEFVVTGQIVSSSVQAFVNNSPWTIVESFAASLPTSEHYIMTVNELGETVIRFGDGITGKIPGNSLQITANGYTTLGAAGNNVEAGQITDSAALQATLPDYPFSANNAARATGGAGVDTVEQLRYIIPASVRTKWRAVTAQDYIDTAQLVDGVVRAGVEQDCGKTLKVFIVPEGGGIASSTLINNTKSFLEQRGIVTVKPEVFSAGEVRTMIRAKIRLNPGASRSQASSQILAALTDFLSYKNQEISGRVNVSDIYELIEAVNGVDSSDLERFTPSPYARPLGTGVPALNWTKTVKPAAASEITWKLVMTATNVFLLYRDNVFMGSFNVGQTITSPELDFVVSSNGYSINDSWEFKTYRYSGNIILNEPSIPVAYSGDIVLVMEGGLA